MMTLTTISFFVCMCMCVCMFPSEIENGEGWVWTVISDTHVTIKKHLHNTSW